MGKAYLNHKGYENRHKDDLYDTPMSCLWELPEQFENVWEPACGNNSLVEAAESRKKNPFKFVKTGDIKTGENFLSYKKQWEGDIVTNPPFMLFDEFVVHAKKICEGRFCFILRMNYFGTHGRNKNGLWCSLRYVYIFDRYIDYRTPKRDDGLFHVGGMCTAWGIWEKGYRRDPVVKFIDMNKYAVLGQYRG